MEGFIDTSSSFPFFEETDFSWFATDDFVFADHVPESPLAEEFLELNTVEFVQPVAQIVEQALVEAPQNVVVSSDLVVTVLQKRRGNGGLWQPLTQDERIRVDKIKGKLVKLIVKSNRQNLSEKDWDVQIFLVDKAHPEQPIHPGDGFTIEQPTRPTKGGMDANCREFKLKLTKISKSQYFYVSASKPGVSLCGYSLEFRSDDNGKVLSSKKRSRHEMETAIVPTAFPPTNTLICKDICADNGLVNMIARSLVPILLDNFQNQLNTGNLEDNIAKRIKLAFAPQIKTEPVSC